jgi:hypothetical protein
MSNIPLRVERCFDKYRNRGIEIWDKLDEEHICRIDSGCPQMICSLFNRDILHVRFPDFMETPAVEHRKNEADVAIWRLATAAACNAATVDDLGFVLCDDKYAGKKLTSLKENKQHELTVEDSPQTINAQPTPLRANALRTSEPSTRHRGLSLFFLVLCPLSFSPRYSM